METLRPLLTTYAYNILGSYDDAKDIVQDSFLKFIEIDSTAIEQPEAYLKRMVINMAINQKKRLNKLVRDYPGEWLPEPIADESADHSINRKEVLSYSMMVLMEKLNPKQRAVFILKEALDYDHSEIADLIEISEESSRQLLSRAKRQLQNQTNKSPFNSTPDFLKRYIDILQNADTGKLKTLMMEEITVISDGGGKVSASINPIKGIEHSFAFLSGIFRKFYWDLPYKIAIINHQPTLLYYQDGALISCNIFSIDNGLIKNVFIIRNPDKLKNLENLVTF